MTKIELEKIIKDISGLLEEIAIEMERIDETVKMMGDFYFQRFGCNCDKWLERFKDIGKIGAIKFNCPTHGEIEIKNPNIR
jgi:hypothetical protein